MHLIPGDPATIRLGEHASAAQVAELREQLGLNAPIYVQFWQAMSAMSRGGTWELDRRFSTGGAETAAVLPGDR